MLSSLERYDPSEQVNRIRSAVSSYFQYVTLSHKWGKGEPLLRDIQGRSIYNMTGGDGLVKLQRFCVTVLERGYLWAWSDTCCIDNESSAELQVTIGSMFSWYRKSSLTVAYLSDVAEPGSLPCSAWLTRGWTLAELLAPQTMLFFTKDWSPYMGGTPSNHKMDPTVLHELQEATGIAQEYLVNFCPGSADTRLRLQWASMRRTSRPEDIAYSLFGIFQVHLPVLYGESAERALGRLLAEVISQSGDVGVLDW
ncbi:hypothetical protein EDD15DRAFT_2158901, partial [Pisolithus albus]